MSTSISPPNGIQPEVIRALAASTGPHPVPGADVAQAASLARWFAVYTCANHEKRVADQFAGRGVEHLLPQYESVRRWKDRKMRLQLPLFPGYLFVHMAAQERLRVLQVPGVVRLVGFNGSPTAMPEEDLHRIREFLGQGCRVEPHPYLQARRRARVVRRALAGRVGVVARRVRRS